MVNDSIDNLRLDINKPKARVSLSVRKGDTKTRTIHVSLTSNGAVYSLENVLIAELLINKPDGKVCDQDMVIKGNELQYTFRTQDTNVEGECVCQIRLMFKDGAYLVSPEFYMYVYNMILDNKTSKSENEYSHTDELLVKANEYYENAETLSKQVEDAVTEASGYADTAEGFKDDAETAKTAAETAQTAAETAKTGAETAKTGAETAKAGAEAALASAQAIDTNVSTLKATCLQAVTDCKAEVVNAQTEVTNATNQATLAAASAVAAATSATNAATSEGNALNYAQDALNSELHAKGFKDDAEAAKNDLESKLITATTTNAGIVKPDGISITVAADGTISASGSGAIASTTTLGSVKVDGTTITADPDGTIHGASTTPIATTTTEGTVKPDGTTITVLSDGTISAVDTTPIATTTAVGTVKADGTTITVAADGTISATGTTSPIATTSTAGIVIPDGTTITVDSLGKISAVDATPIATTTTEGTVKPDGTTITVLSDGTISAVDQTPIATTSVAGTVIPDGTTITVDASGNISAVDTTPIATTSVAGSVIPDGTTITVDASGNISAVDTTPIATTSVAGSVIPDGTTITVDASGNISAVDQTPIATTSVAGSVIPDGTTITVDASGNISAVQQEADDVTYDNTTSGLTATDVQDAIDEVNTKASAVNYSNENLLDNGWFTVNQRGVTTWSGEKINYFVDRWIAYIGTDSSVSITDGGLKCVRATNYCYIQQKLPSDLKPMLIGKIATFSLLLSNNEVYSITTQLSDDRYYEMMFSKDIGVNFGYNLTGTVPVFQFVLNKTLDITIKAIKLELGSVSTLANDVAPNYATELAKCQRYYQKLGGMTYLGMGTAGAISTKQCYPIIQLAVPMRAVPSVTYNLASIYVYGGGLANSKGNISAITVNKYIANMPNIKLSITVSADLFTAGQVYNIDFGDSHYIELSADL